MLKLIIIILLVIIAAGIVWVVVKGVVQNSAEQVELGSRCLSVDVQFASFSTNGDASFKRGSGGEEIAGLKIVLFNDNANTEVQTLEGNMQALASKTYSRVSFPQGGANKIEYTPYFETSSGKELVCQNTRTASFTLVTQGNPA